MGEEEEENYYEDPAFYAGINEGIFSAIDGIWNLIDRGNGNNNQPTTTQQPQDFKALYIGFGILGILLIIVLLAVILKKS